jgi:aspartate/methionine/tyrosine aminotransferase
MPDYRVVILGGVQALRAAVAARCYTSLGPEDVLLCSRASEALLACALALRCRERPVVALPGTYPSFTGMLRALGAPLSILRALFGAGLCTRHQLVQGSN